MTNTAKYLPRIQRLVKILGMEWLPGTWVDKYDGRWWVVGAMDGDQPLPCTNGCRTLPEALDAVEAWYAPMIDKVDHTTREAEGMLDCPECSTPAIPNSTSVDGKPVWTEDDPNVWCPGCGCLLCVFMTGDSQGNLWMEARVVEYSGKDWRLAIEKALGVDDVFYEHTPEFLGETVQAQREIGNNRISQEARAVLGPAFAVAHAHYTSLGVEPLKAAELALAQARECVDSYKYAINNELDDGE